MRCVDSIAMTGSGRMHCRSVWWDFVLIHTWAGDVLVDAACVTFMEGGAGVDTETWFWVSVPPGYPEHGQENARDKSPEEAGVDDVVGQLFLFAQSFVDSLVVGDEIIGVCG